MKLFIHQQDLNLDALAEKDTIRVALTTEEKLSNGIKFSVLFSFIGETKQLVFSNTKSGCLAYDECLDIKIDQPVDQIFAEVSKERFAQITASMAIHQLNTQGLDFDAAVIVPKEKISVVIDDDYPARVYVTFISSDTTLEEVAKKNSDAVTAE